MRRGTIPGIRPRLAVAGRIRVGDTAPTKDGTKTRPVALGTFRFTSQHREPVDVIAGVYGGEVTPWTGDQVVGRQWQVTTGADVLDVMLPPDPLDGPRFELWGGGGMERSCDTVTCEVQHRSPTGVEMRINPGGCVCAQERADMLDVPVDLLPAAEVNDPLTMPRACGLRLRLQVLLPDVPLVGAWRIDTGSKIAAETWPAMVDTIQRLQAGGLPHGRLFIQDRESFGGAHRYKEILLGLRSSPAEIAAARTAAAALEAPAPRAAIGPAPVAAGDSDPTAEIVAAFNRIGDQTARRNAKKAFCQEFGVERPEQLRVDQYHPARVWISGLVS